MAYYSVRIAEKHTGKSLSDLIIIKAGNPYEASDLAEKHFKIEIDGTSNYCDWVDVTDIINLLPNHYFVLDNFKYNGVECINKF